MTDFSSLNITSAGDMLAAIKGEVVGTSTQWFEKNQGLIGGYLEQLSQAAVDTAQMLANGQIPPAQAAMMINDQKAAFEQVARYTEFMTLALMQTLLDGITRVIGWAILNRTGINLFPSVVQPGSN